MADTPFLVENKASYDMLSIMTRRRIKDSIDLLNQRFGKLLVTERLFIAGVRGVRWKCTCDCGQECVAYGGHLRAKNRTSCGCRHEVNIEKTGCKILFNITKRRCKKNEREFSLSLDEFSFLLKSPCVYCGSPPSQVIKRMKSKKIQIIYSGIDRVDSSLGYSKDNCVSCCKFCNVSKASLSLEDWKTHLRKIFNHMGL